MENVPPETAVALFKECASAVGRGVLIRRVSSSDKEFHFQNWFKDRVASSGFNYEAGGRNSYPDFRLVKVPVGYEIKGLAYPGRDASFDCNSQVPTGFHNGRDIYYVFGRYPKDPDGDQYPVLDLVLCHGDFLNAHHDYVHKNKNVRGFGSYGDILIRDRKMYVAPTPFRIVYGLAHRVTLILPSEARVNSDLVPVGDLIRVETEELIVGYSFDLETNEIEPSRVPNPSAGKEHRFTAWRAKGAATDVVRIRDFAEELSEGGIDEDEL